MKDVVLPSLKDVAVLNDAIRPRDVDEKEAGDAVERPEAAPFRMPALNDSRVDESRDDGGIVCER